MGFVTPPPAAVENKRPRDAVSPIGSFPNSDVILRSSDQVSFRAHKAVLSVASPFFADMFSLPQPSPSTASSSSSSSSSPTIPSTTTSADSDLPVIEMAETEEELALMLSYCYPVEEPTISDFKILTRALAVARKFDMDGMRSRLKRQLMSFVPRFPERVFAVAWAYEMRDVARAAARESLRTPLATMQYVEEFELVSGGALFALLKYQRRCVDAVMALKYQTHRWLADEEIPVSAPMSPTPNRTRTCTCATVQIYIKSSDDGGQIPLQVKEWWHSYIPRACEELARNPLGSTLQKTSLLLPSLIKAHECHACRYSDYEDAMQSLAARLQSEVALAISTIEL